MVIDSNIYSSCFVIIKTKPPLTKKGGGAEKLCTYSHTYSTKGLYRALLLKRIFINVQDVFQTPQPVSRLRGLS